MPADPVKPVKVPLNPSEQLHLLLLAAHDCILRAHDALDVDCLATMDFTYFANQVGRASAWCDMAARYAEHLRTKS
jgi:hypothetical protein